MSAKKKSNSRKWLVFGIIAVIIAGISIYILTKPVQSNYESVEAKTGDISTFYSFTGNVGTKNRQTVIAEIVMQISTINVKEDDMVKTGDVLFVSSLGEEIAAEIDGRIVNLNVEENEQVMSGMKIMEIVDYEHLQISIKVDEYDLKAMTEGKETTVKIGALDIELKGTINSVSDEGQSLNGVAFFAATIDLEKNDALKVGMSAEVTLLSEKASAVVVLPMEAISFDSDNNPYVFLADEKGLPVTTTITTGITDGTSVEIKSGVTSGQTVLYTSNSSTGTTGIFGNRRNTTSTGGAN
jgi:HlyD family secretion protein